MITTLVDLLEIFFIKFRLGVSKINCHRYKFYKNETLLNCPFCSCEIESEYHVLYVCNVYSDLRVLLPISFNEIYFNTLLSESMYHKCLARFLFKMNERRDELIDNDCD